MTHDIRPDLKYTEDHEWLKIDGGTATIGITDHAQAALGDLVYVELPEVGKAVKKGDSFAVVESVKAASEVYAPVSGEVVEVNELLNDEPQTINDSAFDNGWIAKIKISTPSEVEALMSPDDYTKLLDEAA